MPHTADQTTDTTSGELTTVRTGVASFLTSMIFWATLITAAAGYATAALSPQYIRWQTAQQDFQRNAAQLEQLATEIRQLDGLVLALQEDPEFAAALSAARNGTENPELARLTATMRPNPAEPEHTPQTAINSLPAPWQKLLLQTAQSGPVRTRLLWGSAALTLLAFTFLNDAGGSIVIGLVLSVSGALVGLYRRYSPKPTALEKPGLPTTAMDLQPHPATTSPALMLFTPTTTSEDPDACAETTAAD